MNSASAGTVASVPTRNIADVSEAEWSRLAQRTIFFGHQSVGDNIVEGIQEVLAANPTIPLRVVEAPHLAGVKGAAFVHAKIGQNYDPASKDTAFASALAGADSTNPIAMYKYCFVDVDRNTDPERLFAQYAASIENVRAQHPQVQIVHITLPLWSVMPASGPKALAKKLLGRGESPELEANLRRNRFNRMLLARYGGKDPIFDLAALESTRPNGTRASFARNGETVYTMAEELTSDGGHLNELGRRRIAEAFLVTLAGL